MMRHNYGDAVAACEGPPSARRRRRRRPTHQSTPVPDAAALDQAA